MISEATIRQRLAEVNERIAAAAVRSGRKPEDVRLVVVTKGHPVETIRKVLSAGAGILGENYADHAVPKIQALGDCGAEWHMIGHIQSRKSKLVAENFQAVHSLDSVKLARRLNEAFLGESPLPVLLQVNVSGEAQKFGIPAWDADGPGRIAGLIRDIQPYSYLKLCGLMTIPPFLPAEEVRPYFARLVRLRDTLQAQFPELSLRELSMGMSGDYEAAIEEGATLVRVGTAILGPRNI